MERLAGKIKLLRGWHRTLTAVAFGAMAALSQPPFDFLLVGFVSFPVLAWLLDGAVGQSGEGKIRRVSRPFFIGWWFGFGYFVAGLWWTGNALLVEADLFAWALPLAIFGLPAVLAVFYGLATGFAHLFWSDGLGRIAALAFGFGLAEWLRTFVLTGFPWNAIGQAAMPVPLLMQSVSAVGMLGMNTLTVLVFAMPAIFAAKAGRSVGVFLAAILMALHAGFGAWRLYTADPNPETLVNVRIVQASIDQSQKWDDTARDRIFATHLDLSERPPAHRAPSPELIVWPETSIPFILSQRPDALTRLGNLVQDDQTLLVGAVRTQILETERTARYYNAVVAVNTRGEIYDAVDKIRLVPFGEYLPLSNLLSRFGMTKIVESVSDFSSGVQRHTIVTQSGVRVLPFICYEIIFPGIAGYGDAQTDLILNVTNDAWFGDTLGPYQHFRMAQLRAVEAGRPLLRAANNGISGVVDAYGRIVDSLAIDAVGVLDIAVPRQKQRNVMAQYPLGAIIFIIIGLWIAASVVRPVRRSN